MSATGGATAGASGPSTAGGSGASTAGGSGPSVQGGGGGGASTPQQSGPSDAGLSADGAGPGGKTGSNDAGTSTDSAGPRVESGPSDALLLHDGGSRDTAVSTDSTSLGGRIDSGGSTGAADVGTPGGTTQGTFPRADPDPSLQSVSGSGPYQYQSYNTGFPIAGSAFLSATIFYPTTARPPFAAVAFCPGFTEVESGFLTWGQLLASHGIVALILTPQNTLMDLPEVRGDQLLAALDTLVSENTRADGALNGKIATDRLGVMGHSMGGGGTLFACNKGSSRIKAAIPLMPWQPLGSFPNCTAPTLLVAAEADVLVDPEGMAYPEYQSLGATDKVYMEVAGADHTAANDVSGGSNLYARYGVSWLKVHLEDDPRYEQFLSGAAHQADVAAKLFAKYEP